MKQLYVSLLTFSILLLSLGSCRNENNNVPSTAAPEAPETEQLQNATTSSPPISGVIPEGVQYLLIADAKESAIERLKLPANTAFLEDRISVEKARSNDKGYLVTLVREVPESGEEKKIFVIYLYVEGDILDINSYRLANVMRQ